MIDLHNHVLPNIDDGSKSLDISLSMLACAAEQGITNVVNTVHYQHPKVEGLDISYKKIQFATEKLQNELNVNNIPIKLHIGAEVYYLPNLLEIKDDPLVTFGNGKYMLIEFQPYLLPNTYKQIFFDLKMSGITPIIAHPERYKTVQDNFNIVYEWLNLGYLIQVSAGSLLGRMGKPAKIIAEKIIMNNYCQVLGSDAHNNSKRNFLLKEALEIAEKLIGKEAYKLVYDNPKSIINGRPISINPIEYKENKFFSFFWNILKHKNEK